MVKRKTIRPVTLRRVIETCSLAVRTEKIDVPIVSQKLGVNSSRVKEILLEVEKMGLLTRLDDSFSASDKTIEFLEYFENDQWNEIHEYFLKNYQFYRDFIQTLESHINCSKGLSMNEISEEAISNKLSLNQTAIEVLSDWCDRLGVVQRHLYTRRLYLIKRKETDPKIFKDALTECYRELSFSRDQRGIFVEIPTIRENICERLKITRKVFDETLRLTYIENVGKIELSGAPIVTLVKKSPLGEKKMKLEGKDAILSPKFEVTREREGLVVVKKAYYYLAIHEAI